MASPFTEMEWCTILFCLLVFSVVTLYGIIQERCEQTTGFELVFIFIAFTIMCLFGLAAVYRHKTNMQDDYIQIGQKTTQNKNKSKRKQRVVTKANIEIP